MQDGHSTDFRRVTRPSGIAVDEKQCLRFFFHRTHSAPDTFFDFDVVHVFFYVLTVKCPNGRRLRGGRFARGRLDQRFVIVGQAPFRSRLG